MLYVHKYAHLYIVCVCVGPYDTKIKIDIQYPR